MKRWVGNVMGVYSFVQDVQTKSFVTTSFTMLPKRSLFFILLRSVNMYHWLNTFCPCLEAKINHLSINRKYQVNIMASRLIKCYPNLDMFSAPPFNTWSVNKSAKNHYSVTWKRYELYDFYQVRETISVKFQYCYDLFS